jgi:uncharacterized protein DUF2017
VRDRIRRVKSGRYRVRLRTGEGLLLGQLVQQLREQLVASTDDPHLRRLFPPAYADDAERDAGYQVLTRDDLLEAKLKALDLVEASMRSGDDLDGEGLAAWMTVLNALRLVIGTRLDVGEELPELDPDDPMLPDYAVYEFLGWLLGQVVDALDADLPRKPG